MRLFQFSPSDPEGVAMRRDDSRYYRFASELDNLRCAANVLFANRFAFADRENSSIANCQRLDDLILVIDNVNPSIDENCIGRLSDDHDGVEQ